MSKMQWFLTWHKTRSRDASDLSGFSLGSVRPRGRSGNRGSSLSKLESDFFPNLIFSTRKIPKSYTSI